MDKDRGVRISQETWRYLSERKLVKGFSSIDAVIVDLINCREKFYKGKKNEKNNS